MRREPVAVNARGCRERKIGYPGGNTWPPRINKLPATWGAARPPKDFPSLCTRHPAKGRPTLTCEARHNRGCAERLRDAADENVANKFLVHLHLQPAKGSSGFLNKSFHAGELINTQPNGCRDVQGTKNAWCGQNMEPARENGYPRAC